MDLSVSLPSVTPGDKGPNSDLGSSIPNHPADSQSFDYEPMNSSSRIERENIGPYCHIPGDTWSSPTTNTPQFLGLKKHVGLCPAAGFGDDMIIGIIDSGIWLESESFKDHGMPRIPDQWRGACEIGTKFNTSNCNRKLIEARSFSKALKQARLTIGSNDYDSPRDVFGHGSDTSSTAAGSHVIGAEYFVTSDPLAAIDQAIEDGVDLMSLSGPDAYTTTNGAPWITTASAGTLDRDYAALVTLGEGTITFKGKSVYPENLYISGTPLYYGHGDKEKMNCSQQSLGQSYIGNYGHLSWHHEVNGSNVVRSPVVSAYAIGKFK
ncbi:hypothetical protein Syun_015276 [Stephania yunnanensis]|uniref:Peptidase S8/S53 domain-containing protein n=1 Tax=Stephania yunnanensis TaxID=152371 RepID=A0AAP0JLY3_9MAGN